MCNFYVSDLSPQESTLLHDIVEVGHLPNFVPEDEKTRYAFYLLTHQGLKFECSSTSKIQVIQSSSELQNYLIEIGNSKFASDLVIFQVDSWVRALTSDCKLRDSADMDETKTMSSQLEDGSW